MFPILLAIDFIDSAKVMQNGEDLKGDDHQPAALQLKKGLYYFQKKSFIFETSSSLGIMNFNLNRKGLWALMSSLGDTFNLLSLFCVFQREKPWESEAHQL